MNERFTDVDLKLHNQNYARTLRAAARTHFFADHSGARCPFVSLLVQSCGTKLS